MNESRIASVTDLEAFSRRGRESLYPNAPKVIVGMASCGLAAGGGELFEEIGKGIAEKNLGVVLARTGCIGFCQREPLVDVVIPGGPRVIFSNVKPEQALELLAGAAAGRIATKGALAYIEQPSALMIGEETGRQGAGYDGLPHIADLDFYRKQFRVALRNCGLLTPGCIDEYIARRGFQALLKCLKEMDPEQVIDQVTSAGLRGRGGAGFPTGRKWGICRSQPGDKKFVICNGDEGDPGAFMDRSIMEGDPFSVIEGMTIGAYAIGAQQGYIYVRGEYPLAAATLADAVKKARAHGLLGENIVDSGFNFDIDIVKGAGAFVCGEETGMIAAIEGNIGSPRQRPPYPAQRGLWGNPTNINNVETWADTPALMDRGPDWFAGLGTDESKGTKVFSLVGKVENTGLVEVPMGITLREIVFDVGGGIQKKRKFKAVQTGGPSGGCIPESLVDLPVDYERLTEAGAMMGSGGLIVMDERTCMVDVAKYFLGFLVDESCGKCTPCREGVYQMHEILSRIVDGKGEDGDIDLLERLAGYVKSSSLCQLGGTAPNPVLSTLRYFRDEYEAHIKEKRCPAGVCKALVTFSIDSELCKGCMICKKSCPVEAISGEKKQPHHIDAVTCTKCGVCYEDCPFNAIRTE